ncbi:hypothetical protein GCM10011504_57320 [Siccirubricoccus deserti]|nr:hypothetical protein GCM10011504_57320 [Siccirubricoccus deserti]
MGSMGRMAFPDLPGDLLAVAEDELRNSGLGRLGPGWRNEIGIDLPCSPEEARYTDPLHSTESLPLADYSATALIPAAARPFIEQR